MSFIPKYVYGTWGLNGGNVTLCIVEFFASTSSGNSYFIPHLKTHPQASRLRCMEMQIQAVYGRRVKLSQGAPCDTIRMENDTRVPQLANTKHIQMFRETS